MSKANQHAQTTTAWPARTREELVSYLRASPSSTAMQAAATMLEAQAQEVALLRQLLAQTAGVAITMLYDSHREDVKNTFSVEELTQIVAFTQPLVVADSRCLSTMMSGFSCNKLHFFR